MTIFERRVFGLATTILFGLGCGSTSSPGTGEAAPAARNEGAPATPTPSSPEAPAPPAPSASEGASLVLEVTPVRPSTKPLSGRLAVFWFQLDDDGPDPSPEVVYDVPFDGKTTTVAIPLGALAPPSEPNLYCARACEDEAACACTGGPRIGFAYVAVVTDTNGNGKADVTYGKGGDTLVGVAEAVLVYSPDGSAPAKLDPMFPEGVLTGLAVYTPVERQGTSWEALASGTRSTSRPLRVCDTSDPKLCQAPVPNLM
jgi:hypothetical protein